MSYELLAQYLRPDIIVIAIVLYCIGNGLKKTKYVSDFLIPAVLLGIGIVLVALYVVGTAPTPKNYHDVIGLILEIIVQGVLCSAISVYANQFKKQLTTKRNN